MQISTKGMLAKSLCTVLHHKSIDKITVKDIVSECDFTRQTFYNHFSDIYELAQFAAGCSAKQILDTVSGYENWQQGFHDIMVEIQKNKIVVTNVYRSIYRELMEKYIYDIIYGYILAIVEKKAIGMNIQQKDKDFIARFYSIAFIGLILEWFKTGMKDDPKEIVDQISILVEGNFDRALLKYSK